MQLAGFSERTNVQERSCPHSPSDVCSQRLQHVLTNGACGYSSVESTANIMCTASTGGSEGLNPNLGSHRTVIAEDRQIILAHCNFHPNSANCRAARIAKYYSLHCYIKMRSLRCLAVPLRSTMTCVARTTILSRGDFKSKYKFPHLPQRTPNTESHSTSRAHRVLSHENQKKDQKKVQSRRNIPHVQNTAETFDATSFTRHIQQLSPGTAVSAASCRLSVPGSAGWLPRPSRAQERPQFPSGCLSPKPPVSTTPVNHLRRHFRQPENSPGHLQPRVSPAELPGRAHPPGGALPFPWRCWISTSFGRDPRSSSCPAGSEEGPHSLEQPHTSHISTEEASPLNKGPSPLAKGPHPLSFVSFTFLRAALRNLGVVKPHAKGPLTSSTSRAD